MSLHPAAHGAVLGTVAALGVACAPPPAAETKDPPPEVRAVPAPVAGRPWSHTTLGRGETLARALARVQASDAIAAGYAAALAERIDLRRLPAGTGLAVSRDTEGRVVALALRYGPARDYLRVTTTPAGGTEVEARPLPLRREVRRLSARVDTTVAEALATADAELGGALTLAFSEIVQWDVDLFVDPRPGDTIRVVYEVLRLGEVPEDLPPFGDEPCAAGEVVGLGRILAAAYLGERQRVEAYWVSWDAENGGYYDGRGRALRKTFLRGPLNYRRVSSRFAHRRLHPITREVIPHHGVDFAAAAGTPVVAAADGHVHFAGWRGPLGRAVELRHGGGYRTLYGHLERIARGVRPGVPVKQNQVIGYVGSTGRATGPHLHYAVLRRGRPIDPLRMANPPAAALEPAYGFELARAQRMWGEWLAGDATAGTLARAGEAARTP